ncbi:glutathione-dependent formaldehyde-activating, GFA [Shewanella sediminis HAW-EB3]|uniref:Glutathione-dependent formaldehyde-activating, GFA n=1 Tax=Shewanella sediminis (strain HAW-EB3) TaxID=425104 RepID=A8FS41_SHESH|nr:GFA family protein [Shewanella sediminis]ABV35664.1 glutathione-dependent formaldehyde-activating, GFA [Shewanella sediminis HAW-EB3]
MTERKGQCLCGAVKFVAKNSENSVAACHCGMCRTWGGGPLMAVSCGSDVSFEGKENISVYSSSDWAERGFCKNCGSHLFYRLKQISEYQLSAGLFDSQSSFKFDLQVYIDKKPSFYSFANKTSIMTEAEVIAKYAPDQNI